MMQLLFSYGTLQNESVQQRLFGRLLHGTKESLPGYRLATVEIRDEAFLAKGEKSQQQTVVYTGHQGDAVEGTAFAISEEELFEADTYEPVNYKRIQVSLQSGKLAWIYAAL